MEINQTLKIKILKAQKNEITEHITYKKLSAIPKEIKTRKILEKISMQELSHYNFWKKYSRQDALPNHFKANLYYFISKFLGLNFGLRLMEKGEESAQEAYGQLKKFYPDVRNILEDEEEHEDRLLDLLGKHELTYTGSVILGLNDALVELTGALAGFTLALKEAKIIAIAGLISGIAASLSMAGSEYLSIKEEGAKKPVKASLYTGIAYIIVVFFLILPYFLLKDPMVSLAITIAIAILIILIFNFYISVAKGIPFKKRFLEMLAISLGVAALSFFIGLLARRFLNVEI